MLLNSVGFYCTALYYLLVILIVCFAVVLCIRQSETLIIVNALPPSKELAVISLISVAGAMVVYGQFVVGDQSYAYGDIGSDTINQYVGFYLQTIDSVRDGSFSFWTPTFGLGVSTITIGWTKDPFFLVVLFSCLLFGDTSLSLALVLSQILKMVISGAVVDRLLVRYCHLPLARIAGSCLYAFNGFLMLWGQHYWFGTACVLLPVLVLQYERLLEDCDPVRFVVCCLAVATVAFSSLYTCYMCLLSCVAYLVIRSLSFGPQGWRSAVASLLPPLVATTLGLMSVAMVIIPSAHYLLAENHRIGGSTGLVQRVYEAITSTSSPKELLVTASRFMGNSLLLVDEGGVTSEFCESNYYELPQIGLSPCIFVFLGMLLAGLRSVPETARRALLAFLFLTLLYFTNAFLPCILNAMAYRAYRSTFVLLIPLTIAVACGIEAWLSTNCRLRWPIAIAYFVSAGIIAVSYCFSAGVGRSASMVFAGILAVSFVIVAICMRKRPPVLLLAFVFVALAGSAYDAYLTVNARRTLTSDTFPRSQDTEVDGDTMTALEWLRREDGSLYRVEKTYMEWTRTCNDALAQHYWGAACYNSTMDEDIQSFIRNLWPGSVPGGIDRNIPYFFPLLDFDHADLLSYLGAKYILSKEPLGYSWVEEVAHFGDVIVYRNSEFEQFGTAYSCIISESEFERDCSKWLGMSVQAIVPDDVTVCKGGGAVGLETAAQVKLHTIAGDHLIGTVESTGDCIVSIPIPNTTGWEVAVDGKQVNTFRTNYGFIGFSTGVGRHEVEMRFVPFGMRLGTNLSVLGVVLTAVLANGKYMRR